MYQTTTVCPGPGIHRDDGEKVPTNQNLLVQLGRQTCEQVIIFQCHVCVIEK